MDIRMNMIISQDSVKKEEVMQLQLNQYQQLHKKELYHMVVF